jgi:uracil-DNA glycosylase
MSSASLGSHAAAWAVEHGGDIVYVSIRAHDAQEWAGGGPVDVVPLYRHPQPTLTDAEREAIETAMNAYGEHNDDPECETIEAALWGLLERTK